MPAIILLIIGYVQTAIKFAPQARQIYDDGRALIAAMFSAKLITQQQQDDLMLWADAHEAAALNGETPPEFLVIEEAELPAPAAPEAVTQVVPETALNTAGTHTLWRDGVFRSLPEPTA